ncbi:MAG TPA: hypothetical protein VK362_09540, partial [Reyranella sp.]|nr:hypothetical protein [Reyranella sp.]
MLGLTTGSLAQTPSASPQPIPQAQFDALVEAVKKAVADEMRAQGTPSATAAASPAGAVPAAGTGALGTFRGRLNQVIAALPQANAALKRLPQALDESATGGRGAGSFLAALLAAVVAALAVEAIVRAFLARPKNRLATNAVPEKGMRSLTYLGLLALLDGLAVVGLLLASELALGAVFSGAGPQHQFAQAAMSFLLLWRINALGLRLIFRPDLAAARLCDMDDEAARRLYRSIVGVMFLFIFLRFMAAQLAPLSPSNDAIAAARLITSPIVLLAPLWLIVTVRTAAQQWLGGLGRTARYAAFIGRHWLGITIPLIAAIVATQIYGAVTGHLHVPTALVLTLNLLVGVLLFETLLQAFVRRLESQLPGFTPAGPAPTLPDVVARCIRVAMLIGVVVLISESWLVNVLGLVDANAWDRMTGESRTAGITLFVAYVLWEAFRYGTDSYLRRHADDTASTASRLGTLIPLLRVTVAIMLTV